MSPFVFVISLYGPRRGPLPSRFEEAAERLAALDRLYIEMDGSFVWRGIAGDSLAGDSLAGAWQIEGMIYDRDDRIQYVDLQGECPHQAWQQMLEIFAGSATAEVCIVRQAEQRQSDGRQFEQEIWGNPARSESLA